MDLNAAEVLNIVQKNICLNHRKHEWTSHCELKASVWEKKKVESADAYLINHRAVIMAATPLDTVVHLSWG